MAIKVGVNGFGRIGRLVTRVLAARPDFQVVAINDLAPLETNAHLLKYDSVHGPFDGTVEIKGDGLSVNGEDVKVLSERSPAKLPWKELGVQIAVESTGVFRTKESDKGGYGDHLKAGAEKVLLTVPAKDEIDATVVLGVNDEVLKPEHKFVSNASCTTNCLAPMVKVLNDSFGVKRGLMTTIHAYTNDQHVADLAHSDLRRARAAAVNIIPTTTGAAKAVGKVIPALNGKLNGFALRVPVPDGSVTDFVAELDKDADADAVNAAMKAAADGPLKGILQYCEEPIVSSDIVHNPYSCIFDADCTMAVEGNLVKVVGWYDNEWGYSNRVCDLMARLA